MIDVDEKTGLAACAELQKEYSSKSVMFTRCDVTKPDELVNQRHGQNYVASNLFYTYSLHREVHLHGPRMNLVALILSTIMLES